MLDGYNVIGASEEYSRLRDKEGMRAARDSLVDAVLQMATMRGWRVEIVFDAYMTSLTGSRDTIASSSSSSASVVGGTKFPLVSVVYTGQRNSADSYIEKKSFGLSGGVRGTGAGGAWEALPAVPGSMPSLFGEVASPQHYAVGTNDRAIVNAVSSHGGTVLSSERVLSEIAQSQEEAVHIAASVTTSRRRQRHQQTTTTDDDDKREQPSLNSQRDYTANDGRKKPPRSPSRDSPPLMQAALPFNAPPLSSQFTNSITFPPGFLERLERENQEEQAFLAAQTAANQDDDGPNKSHRLTSNTKVSQRALRRRKQKEESAAASMEGQTAESLITIEGFVDPTELLAEEATLRGWALPQYTHEPRAASGQRSCSVFVGLVLAVASGGTKKEARQAAARAALASIESAHPLGDRQREHKQRQQDTQQQQRPPPPPPSSSLKGKGPNDRSSLGSPGNVPLENGKKKKKDVAASSRKAKRQRKRGGVSEVTQIECPSGPWEPKAQKEVSERAMISARGERGAAGEGLPKKKRGLLPKQ